MKTTSVALTGDFHAGSDTGLTPFPKNPVQRKLLSLYEETIDAFGHPDILVVNGDAIDGPQTKGGDLTEPDLNKQDMLAVNLVKMWRAKKIFLISGSAYHTGALVMHEANICNLLREGGADVTFVRLLELEVNGWFRLRCRHKVGNSSIPHSRPTAPSRYKMWGALNAYLQKREAAHLSVFSHIHYYQFIEDNLGAVMTLPAWQAAGGRYPDEACDATVDLGAAKLLIAAKENDGWRYEKRIYRPELTDRTIRVAAA